MKMKEFNIKSGVKYFVSIEWDGNQPPTIWYRRLANLGLKVQGSKDMGPIERRASLNTVVYQEGFIVSSSFSLVRTLQLYAIEYGAVNTDVGEIVVKERFTENKRDKAILKRVENIFGRRGRPPVAQKWVVTCLECMTITDQEVARPTSCHNCGGVRINIRKGQQTTLRDPGGDVVIAWLRCRFGGAHWEPAEITPDGAAPPELELLNGLDNDAWIAMENSPILDQIKQMDRVTAFMFLDAIFVNLMHYSIDERNEKRVKAAVEYYTIGGGGLIAMSEPKELDLFCAAGPLDPRYVALSVVTLFNDGAA